MTWYFAQGGWTDDPHRVQEQAERIDELAKRVKRLDRSVTYLLCLTCFHALAILALTATR